MAFNFYASFKGKSQGQLKGESSKTQKKPDKWTEIGALEIDAENPVDWKTGNPTGARQHSPIVITKQPGSASPLLFNALWNSELFDEIVFEIVGQPSSGSGEVVANRITQSNALINKAVQYTPHHVGGTGGDETVVERITLTNAFIRSYRQRVGDGTPTGSNKLIEEYGISFHLLKVDVPR